jgi:hypothetical protein
MDLIQYLTHLQLTKAVVEQEFSNPQLLELMVLAVVVARTAHQQLTAQQAHQGKALQEQATQDLLAILIRAVRVVVLVQMVTHQQATAHLELVELVYLLTHHGVQQQELVRM